jgi:PAS domain S-box-containing protein
MINPSYENSCRILVGSLNSVLFTLDDSGKITSVSPDCTGILGFLPEEMVGRPISAFVMPEDTCRFGEMWGQAKQGKVHHISFPVIGKEGDFHQAMAFSRSVFDGQEKTVMIGIIGEIIPIKQTEKILRQANTRIHLLNSIVRHDINNQLTVLNGYLSLMEQDDNTLKSKEIVGLLLDATENIHKMVTFTTRYKDIGNHFPVWINVYDAFESARSNVEAAGIQITPESACQDIELFADPMLTKVFYQLIDNSLTQGRMVSEISLQWRPMNGGAIIVYEDNGTGIPETDKSVLFQPGKMKKNGYGLFLAHEILAIFGFAITETAPPEKGMRFEIVVPAGSFRIVKKSSICNHEQNLST